MRKLAFIAAALLLVNTVACGSSDTPVDDTQMTDVMENDAVDDIEQNTQDPDGTVVDTGTDIATDNAWMDTQVEDFVMDIPEGPFWAKEEGDLVTVTDGRLTVELNLVKGTFNIGFEPGLDGIINAHTEAYVKSVEGITLVSSKDPSQRAVWQANQINDGLDDGVTIMMETIANNSIGGLRTYISLHRNTPAVTVKSMVALPIREGFLITKMAPVVTRGTDGGGLLLGPGTTSARMVTGGHEIAYDGNAEALNVTEAVETLNAPGYLANWNSMICTQAGKCVLAGFLNVTRSFAGVAVKNDPLSAFAVGEDTALALFELRTTIPQGSMLTPSRVLTTETAYIDFTENPGEAMTRYARAIATYNGITETGTAPAMFVKQVEQFDLDAQDVMSGCGGDLDTFNFDGCLVDLGWEDDEKNPDSVKFPDQGSENAMKAIASDIKGKGLIAGIALSPFVFDDSSTFHTNHEEWFIEPGELAIVRLGLGTSAGILDLSIEDAYNWAKDYILNAVQEWGYSYIRLYGADILAMGKQGTGNGKSGIESVRSLIEDVKEAAGNDLIIELADGTMLGVGVADAISLTPPQYAAWHAPASKVDATLQLGAMSWGHRNFLDDIVFNVVPGTVFDFFNTGSPTAEDLLGMRLWSVTGGIPDFAETTGDLPFSSELTVSLVKEPWSTDFMDIKVPETWYSTVEGPAGTSYLAGFFRFSGNYDLFALTTTDGSRERIFTMPATEGDFVAFDTYSGKSLKLGEACINPEGATLEIDDENGSELYAIRDLGDKTAPVFLTVTPSIGGGDGFITSISGSAGSLDVEMNTPDNKDLTILFAVPKGATAQLSVTGATEVSSGVETNQCNDIDVAWITITPTSTSSTVSVSI